MAILGWHFLRDESISAQDGTWVEPCATETWDGFLEVCVSGLHFCPRAIDALKYAVDGALIHRVELSGKVIMGSGDHRDKGCASVRRELWRADVTMLLHEFACDVTEQALDRVEAAGGTVDPRSRAAITAKRAWLHGEVTDAELDAARAAANAAANAAARAAANAAARAAANAAAWAARAAAWAAANAAARAVARAAAWAAANAAARDVAWAATRAATRDATRDAAWAATRAAAEDAARDAAWAATRDAAWAAMNADLERRLLSLPEAEENVK